MRAQIAEAQAYKAELATIYDAIGRTAADMASLEAGAKSGAQASRISRELAAIVTGTERATQAILQAAEEIDQSAHALAAALKNGTSAVWCMTSRSGSCRSSRSAISRI